MTKDIVKESTCFNGRVTWLVSRILKDQHNRSYLDANASIWTNLHGHRHPALDKAIHNQLKKIAHSSALGFANEPASLLAVQLVKTANRPVLFKDARSGFKNPKLSKVFFSDDGSTAIEVALKICLQHFHNKNNNKSSKFFSELMEFYTIFHKELYETEDTPLHDPCVIAYLLDPSIFSGKLVNVIVEEDSELTRGETVVDWLGVTNRKPNCFVMDKADDKKFFQLLKNKFATLP